MSCSYIFLYNIRTPVECERLYIKYISDANNVYTITWLLCPFSLDVNRDPLKDTHREGVKSTWDDVSRLFFFSHATRNYWLNNLNFYCIKQVDYIFPCVCTVMFYTLRVNNNTFPTRLRLVLYFYSSLHAPTSSVI